MNKKKVNILNIDVILYNSETLDFELVTTYENDNSLLIDIQLDLSNFYDFFVTDDNINNHTLSSYNIDNSKTLDFELVTKYENNKSLLIDSQLDLTNLFDFFIENYQTCYEIDNSETLDFELVRKYDNDNSLLIDTQLDLSNFYDFFITDENISEDNLTYMNPVCNIFNDEVLSLENEYGYLQYDNYIFIETKDNFLILYH